MQKDPGYLRGELEGYTDHLSYKQVEVHCGKSQGIACEAYVSHTKFKHTFRLRLVFFLLTEVEDHRDFIFFGWVNDPDSPLDKWYVQGKGRIGERRAELTFKKKAPNPRIGDLIPGFLRGPRLESGFHSLETEVLAVVATA